ncbi:MAG TPA: Rieske 2Fe-2S domain-containing protein [Vicinamibacterales bacterium]|jgi:Rieske Fe-S protein|nr:Rieske 2Fe-2S domain-containing protein [Vicinamibacterales bacterium]
MKLPKYSRREFCVQSWQTMSLAAVATAVAGCGGSPTSPGSSSSSSGSSASQLPTINATVSAGVVNVTIDASSPLASTGSAALVATSSGNFLVFRAGDQFTALTATCTHEGCVVSGFQNGTYECPCHGSQFSTSGAVVRGPATRSLASFTTRFANNVLTITL